MLKPDFKVLPPGLPLVLGLSVASLSAAPLVEWNFEEDPGFLVSSVATSHVLVSGGSVGKLAAGGPGNGQAAVFSGANRLTAADSADWSSPRFTVECYFRADGITSSTQVLVSHHNNTGTQRGWHLAVTSGGKLRFYKTSDGDSVESRDMGTVTGGKNYYAAALFDSVAGDVTMVLKGLSPGGVTVTDGFSVASGLFNADSPLSIGATGTIPTGTSFFKGVMDGGPF